MKNKKKINGVMILSFFAIVVAVVSLIAFGFNQVSYAVKEPIGNELPDEFDVKNETAENNKLLSNKSFPIMRHFAEVSCDGDSNGCQDGKKTIPIYCFQREKDTVDTKYRQHMGVTEVPTDLGLIYLMANLYPEVELVPSEAITGNNTDHKVETWISQALIWVYLKEAGIDTTSKISEANKNAVFESAYITFGKNVDGGAGAEDKVGYTNDESKYLVDYYKVKGTNMTAHQVYDKAMELHNISWESANGINISEEGEVSIDEENKYYFSKKLSVQSYVADSSIAEYKDFTIRILEDAPEETIIVDENGEKIENLNNIAPNTKFYIRVPVDSIDEVANIKLKVEGNFDELSYSQYMGANEGDFQTLISLNNGIYSRDAYYNFEFTLAPDTASNSNIAQILCFISLMALLGGIGIVYINTKKTKIKE